MKKFTIDDILQEISQAFQLRKPVLSRIANIFDNRYVIGFYTNFYSPYGSIDDKDAEMILNLLHGLDGVQKKKLLLILDSPGGNPLAAERIVKTLREFSDNDYWVLIPGLAKSAATMICFGASKIFMSPVSELGPIDIQVPWGEEGHAKLQPSFSIIDAYDKLMQKGINLEAGKRIEPILQQLTAFDPAQIEELRQVNELAADIAIKILRTGMLSDKDEEKIKTLLKIFIEPKKSKTHGRPIYYSDIHDAEPTGGFKVELLSTDSEEWKAISEYHVRVKYQMKNNINKLLESKLHSYTA